MWWQNSHRMRVETSVGLGSWLIDNIRQWWEVGIKHCFGGVRGWKGVGYVIGLTM